MCIIAYILVASLINECAKAGSAPITSASYGADSLFRFVQSKAIDVHQSKFALASFTLKTCSTMKNGNPDLDLLLSYPIKYLIISHVSQL